MKQHAFDLIVIGGGPAGIEAIREAGRLGLTTALILNAPAGGRAARGSLVPSKVWLAAAEEMDHYHHPFSIQSLPTHPPFDLNRLKKHISAQGEATIQWSRSEVEKAGARLITGNGKVRAPGQVEVIAEEGDPELLTCRFILIATGSGPAFTPEVKPDMKKIIAPRLTPALEKVPESIIVAGGGVTGTEYAYAFAALGAQVTILQNNAQLLPRMESMAIDAFTRHLQSTYRIDIHTEDAVVSMKMEGHRVQATTQSGKTYSAEYGFIATGRQPDMSWTVASDISLDLDPHGFIHIDKNAQTSSSGIYAAGDVTGAPMMANRAQMQARVAVHHMALGAASTWNQYPVIEGVYTHPPIAQIGDVSKDGSGEWITKSYDQLLKARLKQAGNGLLRIKVDPDTGLILGAAAFGLQASEVLAPIQTALLNGIPYDRLRGQVQAYPGFAEIVSL